MRDRVRARNPETSSAGVPLTDLMPAVHARDAALAKAAAIGTVNPRSGGPINAVVQGWKKLVARVLDWHVREQVEYNRHVVASIDALIEAFNQNNRALVEIGLVLFAITLFVNGLSRALIWSMNRSFKKASAASLAAVEPEAAA